MKKTIFLILEAIALTVGGILIGYYMGNRETPVPVEKTTTDKSVILYDITTKCEELSAKATNPAWSYSNCLKNMKEVMGVNGRVLKL